MSTDTTKPCCWLYILLIVLVTAITGCREERRVADVATANILGTRAALVLKREPDHPYLAEYRRVLDVVVDQRVVTRLVLPKDTGGIRRVNVYQLSPVRFLLRDAAYDCEVDLQQGSAVMLEQQLSGSSGTFVGAFDEDQSHRLIFIPASLHP